MTTVPPGSLVKILRLRGGKLCVATYTQNSPGLYSMKGRSFSDNYGEALTQAQLWTAQGYHLRDEIGRATAASILTDGGRA